MKLRSRIILAFLLMILIPGVFGGVLYKVQSNNYRKNLEVIEQRGEEVTDGQQQRILMEAEVDAQFDYLDRTLIFIMISLVISAFALGIWLYRGVIVPIRQLKKATQEIRDGNLDFEVNSVGVSEVKDLCEDFEEMRLRLKESTEEKLENDRQNKELISNISHDLKTPITAVKGYVEGIMDGVADTPEKMDRYIRTIYNKANEMNRLINELTFYSKIDTNRIPYTFTKIPVGAYFEDCVEDLKLEMVEKHVEITYENRLKQEETVIADAEQIQRVVSNIVSNATKYMDKPEKKLAVRLLDAGDFVQIEFEDNGKGIAAKDLPRIFDRFFRTDVSRNSTRGGSGIGLSIVRKIMEDHGGQVWATSRLGEGTTMHFVLRKYHEKTVPEQEKVVVKKSRGKIRRFRDEQNSDH